MWLLSGFYGNCKPISCGEQELVRLLPFQAEKHYVLLFIFFAVSSAARRRASWLIMLCSTIRSKRCITSIRSSSVGKRQASLICT